MSGSCVLSSRLFVGICAAVILIIMCSHAEKASPAVPIIQKRVKNSILRRLSPEQQVPSLAGRLGEERQAQTPADASSIINHQSQPVHFTQGSFSYSQNSINKTRPRVKITRLQRGGMMRPASSISTIHSPNKGPGFDGSSIPDNSLPQNDENTYNSNINWIKYPKKSGNTGRIPITPLSKVDEDKSARKLNSVFPSQTGRLQSAQLLTQRELGSDFLETNQLLMVRVQSDASRLQPKNALDFTNQAWDGAQSLSNSLSIIKQNPSHEKPPSISKFPQNQNSVSGKEMLDQNNIQSYLFKDSPAQIYTVKNVEQKAFRGQRNTAGWAQTQSLSGTQEKSRFISNFNRFTRTDPNKEESETQIGFVGPRVIFYPTPNKATASTSGFLHPVSEDRNQQNLVSAVHSHSQDSRKAFGVLDRVNVTSREPRQEYTASQSVKRFHRLDGFTNPERKPVKVTSGPSSADGRQNTLDKRVDIGFIFSNAYPLSQKYSFGLKRAAAKLGTVKMSPPSPVTQVSSATTVQPLTSMLKSQEPETGASMNRNENTENRFRLYKGRFGLKGYGSRPLEGAKALPWSADSPVKPKPNFKGFELRSSEVSRSKPIRIYRLYSQRDDKKQGGSGDFKMPPNITRADGSTSRFTSNKAQIFQGFLPSKNQSLDTHSRTTWKYPERYFQKLVSSSYLSSLEQSTDELKPKAADGNKLATEEVPKFKTLTSHTVRGKRVKLTQTGSRRLLRPIAINSTGNSVIRRLARVKAVTYEDVLGNASFSSVRSPGRHQYRFPNMTTVQGGGGSSKSDVKNMSGSPKANVTNEEMESVYRKEEADNEVETSDLFFESEGSGSLDLSDVLSTTSENEPAGNDLLELDYLRKSTGNVSFKSLGKSHLEQQ